MDPFSYDTAKNILFIDRWMEKNNVIAGFTTKFGGQSEGDYASNNLGLHVGDQSTDVIGNRKRLAEQINIPLNKWVFTEQTHGFNVKQIWKKDGGKGSHSMSDSITDTDGLITTDKEILSVLLFADCVPLFFLVKSEAAAISHAGWRGTVGNIANETVQAFKHLGYKADQLEVVIGPSICGDCYEVSQEVIGHIPQRYKEVYQLRNSHYYLNLKDLNYLQLVDAGVKKENILVTSYCTAHDELFFSHRRDKQKTGRMLGFIGLM
ncbi:conserved hypothetical protein [Gracilibacillus ureilyticus]|uniref:Purine nucleoside phosphorylase n=1 Tax=Gracilibacillus ureilyticus TaxID=531814 RepID=A0A1H9KYN5_9BACI|nr:peptidoglycan editing factor PgeF [Gracilibacillus ureilyticus]SER04304.1 conserved hypothetical protein [Gracilibacillus ureilyticus]